MNAFRKPTRTAPWLLLASLLLMTGCQQFRLPAIDPTGQRIFSPTEAARMAAVSDSRCKSTCLYPKPAWVDPITPEACPEPPPPPPPGAKVPQAPPPKVQPRPSQQGVPGTIKVTPTRMIAPVGSEVILVGGLCGDNGYLVTRQPIEWMLSQDSVGQFVDVSDRDSLWYRSKKLSSNYVITNTASRSQVVTRGTPSVTDDVVQQKGQCWVSMTSASEGTSYITAVASKGATWPQRRQSVTIYWVDAQWALPNPVSVPAGRTHTLTTQLTRTATKAPVVGWIVRYEIVDGTPAVLGPGGATAIEVVTDANGLANAPLQPTTTHPGVTQVRIAIIRPADPNSDAPRTKIGEGYTSITWSAPGLALLATGPQVGTVDSTLVYRVEVHNPGDIAARGVVVRDLLPPALRFVSSNPPAQVFGDRAQWHLGDLAAKSMRVIEVNVRAEAGGNVRYSFHAASDDGLQADAAVDTLITRPSLGLKVTGPETATVGQRIQFQIDVTNTSDRPLDNVAITDRFDASLEHADGEQSPIQKMVGRLEPNQTMTIAVGFFVRRAGQICHVVEVSAPGGEYAQKQACLTAAEPAVTPRPQLQVRKTGPAESRVGETAQFSTLVTNTGNVPLTNVRITESYDEQLNAVESTAGWDPAELAAGQLVYIVAQLAPGQSVQRDVLCVCRAESPGATSRVTVTTAEGVSEAAQATVRIGPSRAPPPGSQPPGAVPLPPGGLAVEIYEFGDPLKVGGKTTYEITIKNNRAVPDQNVVLTIHFPPGLRYDKLFGPVALKNLSADRRTVQVGAIQEMRAGEKLPAFRVEATGIQPGEHVLKVRVTSQLSPQGVAAEETTTVFTQ